MALLTLVPIVWMVLTSFKTAAEVGANPPTWWPREWHPENYSTAWNFAPFGRYLFNSVVMVGGITVLQVVTSALAAYAFARLKFRFRKTVLMVFLATYMLPQISLLIPLYMILNSLGLLDTKLGLVLVDCSLVIPFTLWILSNYFLTIPEELEEAARIDGCSRIGALLRVILPSAKPGIFAAIMFAFLLAWDEFMYALIFTSSDASKTLPVAISEFAGRYTTDFGLVAAGGIVAALPPIIIAILFQKYIVSGMAAGAVKG